MQYEIFKCKNNKNAYQQLQGGLRIDFDSSICIHRVFGITFLHSLTFWSCSYHLQLLKKLISKSLEHCGEGQHTKKSMYTFLLIESHTYYEI
jgi:hypothetical protein